MREEKDRQMALRGKALCFDYLQLNETFGIDLETEVLLENET